MSNDKIAVHISREAYEKARKFIEENGGFNSVEELIEFLIDEATGGVEVEGLTKEEEEKVKERLKDLGYI